MWSRSVYTDTALAPFGETYDNQLNGTVDPNFTGHSQDMVAGEYDTPTRQLHPGQGRWLSPDPAGLTAADPANPQSWNLYAYVENQSLVFSDPSGLVLAPETPTPNEDAAIDGGYSQDPLSCDPNDIFCAPDPTRGPFNLFPTLPPLRPGSGILPGEHSINFPIGSGNPITDIWQDGLGLPTIPCGAQFGPWCDPSKLPNPWILDFLESGVAGNGTPDSPWTYRVQVWAPSCRSWIAGDFTFSNCDAPVPAPPEIRGLSEDTTTEFLIAGATAEAVSLVPSTSEIGYWLNQGGTGALDLVEKGDSGSLGQSFLVGRRIGGSADRCRNV